jgi:hypothetical protein
MAVVRGLVHKKVQNCSLRVVYSSIREPKKGHLSEILVAGEIIVFGRN